MSDYQFVHFFTKNIFVHYLNFNWKLMIMVISMFSNPQLKFQAHTQIHFTVHAVSWHYTKSKIFAQLCRNGKYIFFSQCRIVGIFFTFTVNPHFLIMHSWVFCPRSKKSVMISIINVIPIRFLHLFQHDSQTMIKINDFWIKSYWTLLRIWHCLK